MDDEGCERSTCVKDGEKVQMKNAFRLTNYQSQEMIELEKLIGDDKDLAAEQSMMRFYEKGKNIQVQ